MKITSSIEYATRLMASLARVYQQSTLSAEKLSEIDNVPTDYVSQILVKLRRAGLVISQRGSTGGYSLSRQPQEITLGQIVRAVDGDIFEDVCEKYEAGAKDCRHQSGCSISPVWSRLGALVTQYFENITLAAIVSEKPISCGTEPAWLTKINSQSS